jgi:hypothetical protein
MEAVLHPKGGSSRLHGHVLLFNLGKIPPVDLAAEWRELNDIKNLDEPLITTYQPGPDGARYSLKTLGTDVDLIYFSRKLSLRMAAESPL